LDISSVDLLKLLGLPVLLFSIVVHEFGHAYMAYRAGDMTAAYLGRMTLNPIAHLDPIGTVLIPLIQFFSPQPVPLIGWAKPVPINPLRFRSSEWEIFVSLAGPCSNLILVAISAVLMKIALLSGVAEITVTPYGPMIVAGSNVFTPVVAILEFFIWINIALAVFNLVPIPPLDGSHVVYRLLASARSPLAEAYAALGRYGYIILLVIVISPAWRLFAFLIHMCVSAVYRLISWGF